MKDGNEKTDTPPVAADDQAKSFSMPEVDLKSFAIPEVDLKSAIRAAVVQTNGILSTLEERKNETSDLVGSRLLPLSAQLHKFAQAAIVKYEMRQYYGPQIIAGTAATVAGLVSMRRGKIPGVFMGGISGVGAYGAIYGELPDLGKK